MTSRSARPRTPALPRATRSAGGEAHRSTGASVVCRVRVTVPPARWLGALSRAHPQVGFEVLDRLEIAPGRVLFEMRVPARSPGAWSRAIGAQAGVRSVEPITSGPGVEVYRVLYAGRTFLPLVKRHRVLRRFPFTVRNGDTSWTLVGSEPRIRAFLADLGRTGAAFRVESVRSRPGPAGSIALTSRQQEILGRAVAEGYFEVPRRVSLSELSRRIGVANSTLSVTLALIERKIVAPLAPLGAEPPEA